MEKRKMVNQMRRPLALIMALVMVFCMSFSHAISVLATDYGDKKVQGSDQTLTIVFDPKGGAFKDDGTTEIREITFPASYTDNENYYSIITDTDIPALEERPGYTFDGWFIAGKMLESEDRIYDDVTFDAQWSEVAKEAVSEAYM